MLTDVHALSRYGIESPHSVTFLYTVFGMRNNSCACPNDRHGRPLYRQPVKQKNPLLAIIDDSICQKTNGVTGGVQHGSLRFSFLSHGKEACLGPLVCFFTLALRQHNYKSKQEITIKLVKGLPTWTRQGFPPVDTRYTFKGLARACLSKGFHPIGKLKNNHILYPQGIHIQVKESATYMFRILTSHRLEKKHIVSIDMREP